MLGAPGARSGSGTRLRTGSRGRARDGEGGAAHEPRILNFLVDGFLANQVKCARHFPLDVISQAEENLLSVAFPEAIDSANPEF